MKAILMMAMIATSAMAGAQGYNVGDAVADFKLKNIDGKMLSMADNKEAKGYVIIFSCNHCPYVVKYEDRMVALNSVTAPAGYPVIAINSNDAVAYPDDSYEAMKVRAEEKGFNFPYLLDESQAIASAFGAQRTPHVYVVQKMGGKMVVKYIGAIDDNVDQPDAVKVKYVEDAISALNAGKPVPVANTKAIGCGIKWKKS